jgi:outer membrane lipoprotein SlyB
MSVSKISCLFSGFLFLGAAVAVHPDQASAQNTSYCDGYARDFAQRNSTGHVARGTTRGVIGGGLIGGLIGGGKGFGVGALVGGATGAIVGSDRKSRDYNSLYHQAYNSCMRG